VNLSIGVAQAFAALTGPGGRPTEEMDQRQASKLARAAVYLMSQHQRRLNKPAPAVRANGRVRYTGASRPGEYPNKRTGFLQANVTFAPTDIAGIIAAGRVRVGLRRNAFYGAVLEVRYRRLGLKDTLQDLLPQLQAITGQNLQYQVTDSFIN